MVPLTRAAYMHVLNDQLHMVTVVELRINTVCISVTYLEKYVLNVCLTELTLFPVDEFTE